MDTEHVWWQDWSRRHDMNRIVREINEMDIVVFAHSPDEHTGLQGDFHPDECMCLMIVEEETRDSVPEQVVAWMFEKK